MLLYLFNILILLIHPLLILILTHFNSYALFHPTLPQINDFEIILFVFYFPSKELGKSINTDEAAALGAVYQAAHLSQGFRVKKFAVKEATVYPIVVRNTYVLFSLLFHCIYMLALKVVKC